MNLNPGNQFLMVKRLGDIIACALFKPLKLAFPVIPPGQDNNRNVEKFRPCFEHTQKFKTINSRHLQVAQNYIHWR